MGVSWADGVRMPWGVCMMLFESRAEAYEAATKKPNDRDDDVRMATSEDYKNWI